MIIEVDLDGFLKFAFYDQKIQVLPIFAYSSSYGLQIETVNTFNFLFLQGLCNNQFYPQHNLLGWVLLFPFHR